YLATFNLGSSAQFVLGPTIVTVGVVDAGSVGWGVLAAAFVGFALLTGPTSRAAARRLAGPAAPVEAEETGRADRRPAAAASASSASSASSSSSVPSVPSVPS
nr:hypothetical protein [Micromonospora sp. DSM 115978]